MIKILVLPQFSLEKDKSDSEENEDYRENSDERHKPGLVEPEVRAVDGELRTEGVLEHEARLHPHTHRLTERPHPSPVEGGQPDAVDDVRRDVVQHEGGGAGLQGEVGYQRVVGEDLHLVAGHVLVQLPQGGLCPADHGTGGVGELQSHICWREVWNCREREIRAGRGIYQ